MSTRFHVNFENFHRMLWTRLSNYVGNTFNCPCRGNNGRLCWHVWWWHISFNIWKRFLIWWKLFQNWWVTLHRWSKRRIHGTVHWHCCSVHQHWEISDIFSNVIKMIVSITYCLSLNYENTDNFITHFKYLNVCACYFWSKTQNWCMFIECLQHTINREQYFHG